MVSVAVALLVCLLLVAVAALVGRARRLEGEAEALRGAAVSGPAADMAPDDTVMLRSALEVIPLGVVLIDAEGRRAFCNDFASAFVDGRHGEAVVARAIDELAHSAVAHGVVGEREVLIYGPPRRTLFVSARPIGGDGGEAGVIVLIDDVTEQERIDAIRRDFVANISHELRTPIGAMSLLAETLVDETDPEVTAALAGRLSGEAHRLGDTVNDLLQLSRIEHGSDEGFEPVVLQSVVASATDRVRAAAEQHGVRIGVAMPDRDLVVRGDQIQMNSAVFNLLDNAVKYTGAENGSISIRARRLDDQVELVVQDSGIGIPRKDLDRIFERFYRVDRGRSRASGGTGLGLAIVRHVVANHGGRIDVDSTEGEGTTFTLQLPAMRPLHEGVELDPDVAPDAPAGDDRTTPR